jgi:hypothetical protein
MLMSPSAMQKAMLWLTVAAVIGVCGFAVIAF